MAKKFTNVREFNSSLQELRKGSLPPVCVVCGGQDFFHRRAISVFEKLAQKANPGIDSITYQGPVSQGEKTVSPSSVLEELTSRGLFSSEKLVIVRRAQRFLFPQNATDSAPLERLAEYTASPTAGMYLLLECKSLDRRLKVGKALAKNAFVINCPELRWERDVLSWLSAEAREMGHTISSRAAEMLFTVHGSDPGVLAGELRKISIFLNNEPQIDEAAVKNFLGDSAALTGFELTNAVEAKNRARALDAARRMIAQGLSDSGGKKIELIGTVHMALGSLRNCLMRIWRAHDVVARRGNIGDIEQALGMRGKRAETMFRAGKAYSLAEIKHALNTVATTLASLHDTGGDPAAALERAALEVCGTPRTERRSA